MKVDNTFDKIELLQNLSAAYDLPLQSITFFPEGEDSYGYIVYLRQVKNILPKPQLLCRIAACR